MTPLDCADLRRRAEAIIRNLPTSQHMTGEDILALLDLAARLKEALEIIRADHESSGDHGDEADAVIAALAAAKEAGL